MNVKKYWENNWKGDSAANKLTKALFAIYAIVLIWILLLKLGVRFSYMGSRSVNLIPFNEFLNPNGKVDFGGLIMNVIIFVPLGIYAGVLFKKWSFGRYFLYFFVASLMVEGCQFIFKIGTFDITDLMTNTFGGIIGLMVYKIVEKLFKSRVRAQKAINIVASIGTALMILLLVLLKTNHLGIRYQ